LEGSRPPVRRIRPVTRQNEQEETEICTPIPEKSTLMRRPPSERPHQQLRSAAGALSKPAKPDEQSEGKYDDEPTSD
jgi:hypothetical protein